MTVVNLETVFEGVCCGWGPSLCHWLCRYMFPGDKSGQCLYNVFNLALVHCMTTMSDSIGTQLKDRGRGGHLL